MATPSLRRRSSQITFVNDPDTQVAEAGHLARTFVDDEMRKADTDMKELLENIVKAAVDKGDDEAFMKKWEADWLALWNDPRCSRTKKAFEDISRTYNDHGPRHTFRSIPGELRSRLKYKMTTKDWKRGGLTLKINTPNFDSRKRTNQDNARTWLSEKDWSWKQEKAECLLELRRAMPAEQTRAASDWYGSVDDAMETHLRNHGWSRTANTQIKYELTRLVLLIKGHPGSGLAPVSFLMEPYYNIDAIRSHLQAWTVTETAHSLSRRLIGRRVALIHGVAHSENRDGRISF